MKGSIIACIVVSCVILCNAFILFNTITLMYANWLMSFLHNAKFSSAFFQPLGLTTVTCIFFFFFVFVRTLRTVIFKDSLLSVDYILL